MYIVKYEAAETIVHILASTANPRHISHSSLSCGVRSISVSRVFRKLENIEIAQLEPLLTEV